MSQYLGDISAYALAVSQGYTGTEEEYAELMASYATVGQTAVTAAQTATTKASEAATSATTATNKATEATTAAQTATTKAGEASTSASTATSAKDTAVSASQTATTKATEATTAAATATSAATTATTAKDDAVSAKTAAQTAQTAAETAQEAAETAQEAAEDAAESVSASAAQIATNTSDISDLKENLTHKANQDGYYADLVSGGSTQLLSDMVATDTTPYNYRTAGGSLEIGDREKLKKIVGGSLVWNQLFNPSLISSQEIGGVSFTVNNDGSITVDGTATEDVFKTLAVNFGVKTGGVSNFPMGHIAFISGCPSGGSNSTYFQTIRFIGGGKYDVGGGYIFKSETTPFNGSLSIGVKSGVTVSELKFNTKVIDLTAMFGTTIANYVYSLETATAGAGVAWLKAHFPKIFDSGYVPYNAGTLEHVSGLSAHKMVGFNLFDADNVFGSYEFTHESDGSWYWGNSNNTLLDKVIWENKSDYSGRVHIHYTYKFDSGTGSSGLRPRIVFKDGTSQNVTVTVSTSWQTFNITSTDGKEVDRIIFDYGSASNHTWFKDFCINLHWDGERDGEYEPYEEHSYPLDSDVTLRGIPKLDADNNLYYDGDEYVSDGTVTRRYGIVDLGTLTWAYFDLEGHKRFGAPFSSKPSSRNLICAKYQNVGYSAVFNNTAEGISIHSDGSQVAVYDTAYTDAATFKAAMSGVYLVYELATPTTEEADPYTEIQNVSNWGTEEFITTSLVPVGHETAYQPDLRAKIEVAPESPDTDGLYLMKRENGQNSYVAYLGELPSDPTTDGTYTLKCTVSGGTSTKTWEADT